MIERVLLINAPSEGKYFLTKQPPLGLLYIASCLRAAGVGVRLLDLNVYPGWRGRLKKTLKEYAPQIAGISANFSNTVQSSEIAALVKSFNKNVTVVAGGPQPTVAPEEYRIPDIDYIIPYESEKVMLDFCRSGAQDTVPGVLSCRAPDFRRVYEKIERVLVEELDSLPFPAYEMIDVSRYYTLGYRKLPLVSMITSRGCGHNCIFCSQAVSGRKWRKRSAENVVDEMEWLVKVIGAGEISVEDDNFTSDQERVRRICGLIRRKKIRFSWQLQNGIRVDGLNKALLQELKDAGCWKVAIAPEVGDEESLRRIRKGAALEQFREAAAWCREVGIVYLGYFMMGFPFQKEEDMDRTSAFARELDPLCISLTKLVTFPGTPLFLSNPSKDYSKRKSYFYRGENTLLERKYVKAFLAFYGRPGKLLEILLNLGFIQFWRLILNACDMFLLRRG
jgi:anaerobic magnesium-protoporphyrin IX monomethyl ester cyclase